MEGIEYALKKFTPTYGFRKIASITTQDIKAFRDSLFNGGHKVNGVNIILKPISACFNFATKAGYVRMSPAKSVQSAPVKVARYLKKPEIDTLLREGCKHNKELRQFVLIALYSGMRQGEILAIKQDSIKNGEIFIAETKTGNPRKVPIHESIEKFVVSPQWIAKWDADRLKRAFRRAVKRSRLGRVRFHDLRHTFCSNYLENGGTLADLMKITGHLSLAALQIYTHFQPAYLKERINKVQY